MCVSVSIEQEEGRCGVRLCDCSNIFGGREGVLFVNSVQSKVVHECLGN